MRQPVQWLGEQKNCESPLMLLIVHLTGSRVTRNRSLRVYQQGTVWVGFPPYKKLANERNRIGRSVSVTCLLTVAIV